MGRPKKQTLDNPQTPPANVTPVREQIKQMSGFKSAEEMAESLPTDTMTAPLEEKTRRPRRTKAEMEAARAQTNADPLLNDPRYKRAIANMQGFGGPKIVKGGFSAVGLATGDASIPLDDSESEQLDDFFYVLGQRYNVLDPSKHWLTMMLYFFGMLGTFVFTRVLSSKGSGIQKQLAKWFSGKEEKEEKEEE